MQPRTKRQREVLDYLTTFIEERGYEPSYQQIARHFRIASKSAIAKHIAALETQGLLSRQRENGSFGLQVRPKHSLAESVCEIHWLEIPFKDSFEEAWENEPLFIPEFMLSSLDPERICAFRVRNDAMLDEHICEGDIALIEKKPFPRDGDCIVAIVDNTQVVLKKFYRLGAEVEFRPSNPKYETIKVSAEKIEILGIYRGLLRPLN